MTQEFLNHPQVSPALEKVRCKGMPEGMGPYPAVEQYRPRIFYYYTSYPPVCQPRAAPVKEKGLVLFLQDNSLDHVRLESIQGLSSHGNNPLFFSLSPHLHEPFSYVHVFGIQS